MAEGTLSCELELPAGRRRDAPSRPSRATLTVLRDGQTERVMRLPLSVGRALRERLGDGGGEFASWKELDAALDVVLDSCSRARVEDLISRRDYSSHDLASKLASDGFPSGAVQRAVARACEVGLVDDARYAAAFVRSKALAGWGKIKISRELARHGVRLEDLPEGEELPLDPEGELERAREAASRRIRSGRSDYPRLVRFLAGRGYSYDVATRVARELAREPSADE